MILCHDKLWKFYCKMLWKVNTWTLGKMARNRDNTFVFFVFFIKRQYWGEV